MRRVAVRPSITGICRSISTTSKGVVGGGHGLHRFLPVVRRSAPGRLRLPAVPAPPAGCSGCPRPPAGAGRPGAGPAPRQRRALAVRLQSPAPRLCHGVEQHRRRDRLDQEAVEQGLFGRAALLQHLAAVGGDHHHQRRVAGEPALRGCAGWSPSRPCRASASRRRWRRSVRPRRPVHAAAPVPLAAVGHVDRPAQRLCHALQHVARGRVVVDHQRAQRRRARPARRLVTGRSPPPAA